MSLSISLQLEALTQSLLQITLFLKPSKRYRLVRPALMLGLLCLNHGVIKDIACIFTQSYL